MKAFKAKGFARFQRKERISDAVLLDAVRQAEEGLIDADLGHGLLKQRVARPGRGKSGGYRTIIAYRRGERAVFLFGFAKNAKANLSAEELAELARRGEVWLSASAPVIAAAVAAGDLEELAEAKGKTQHEQET